MLCIHTVRTINNSISPTLLELAFNTGDRMEEEKEMRAVIRKKILWNIFEEIAKE